MRREVQDPNGVDIEFLAAVATFGTYEDESGKAVRYLQNIEYLPTKTEGTLEPAPQSLLPFFDETRPPDGGDDAFFGIATAVIGSGLNGDEDGEKIKTFLETMSTMQSVPVQALEPNAEFASMTEEFQAFRLLDADGKAEAIQNRTMGPGKVAKFAMDTAHRLIADRKAKREQAVREAELAATEQASAETTTEAHVIDPEKQRFACRKCRTLLFGEDDFENPPHVPAQHNFGYRKTGALGTGERNSCQSIFLESVPPEMATDTSMNEGKIACPKCGTKVGHWNWSGAQCSCGTWVCPAIQVPLSRVDKVLPHGSDALPTGTVVSPLLVDAESAG